jgi:hypothetical protein
MRSHFYLLDMTAFRLSPPVFFGLAMDLFFKRALKLFP